MKVCFVGLGSIGCRHLKNLIEVCKHRKIKLEIHAFREGKRVLPSDISELIHNEIFHIRDIHNDYDIVFITNPTYKHYETLKIFFDKTKHIFMEKPIFDKSTYDLSMINKKDSNSIYYVASPLRYTNVIDGITELIKKECIYSVRVICSSYLPSWRVGVDYREVYSAHKDQGGGVSIDCIHELDYIVYLFGLPKNTVNIKGKYSNLEIDSEDLSVYILQYKDKIVELHLDYFGRERKREIEILTKDRVITGDFVKNEIRISDSDNIKYVNDNNRMYVREIENFLDMITKNKKNTNSLIHANKILKLAEGE